MAAIVSDIKLCQTVKRLFEIALFAAHPRQGEQDRSPLARLSYLRSAVRSVRRRVPPKSLAGREEVSLSPRAIIAHSVPQLCLRKAVGAPLTAVFTSWLPASWRRFSLAPARVMYLFCCVCGCQSTYEG